MVQTFKLIKVGKVQLLTLEGLKALGGEGVALLSALVI